jgi:hypothetical protein
MLIYLQLNFESLLGGMYDNTLSTQLPWPSTDL